MKSFDTGASVLIPVTYLSLSTLFSKLLNVDFITLNQIIQYIKMVTRGIEPTENSYPTLQLYTYFKPLLVDYFVHYNTKHCH